MVQTADWYNMSHRRFSIPVRPGLIAIKAIISLREEVSTGSSLVMLNQTLPNSDQMAVATVQSVPDMEEAQVTPMVRAKLQRFSFQDDLHAESALRASR